jgi:hypothetical protein
MFLRRILLTLLVYTIAYSYTCAQTDDFCDAITAIVRDAPNQFRNIKGKAIRAGTNALAWECGIKVSGSIDSRFVASNGLFYEGAFFQSKNKNEVRAAYDKYKELLGFCLQLQGYKLTVQDNFYPGMSSYKKLAFMPEIKGDIKLQDLPAHVTMETTYSKDVDKYTIVVYIFEH